MTSPDTTTSTANTDAPTATVPWGKSEYMSYLIALGSLFNGYLGHDYGLSKNAQALSLLIGALIVVGQNISRAIKHHAAIHANAAVYIAQLQHVTNAVTAAGGYTDPAAIAKGVAVLNQAVVDDTAAAPAKSTSS
jgi:hypothetical protein